MEKVGILELENGEVGEMDNWKNEQLEMADLGNWKCRGFQNWGHSEFGIKNKL